MLRQAFDFGKKVLSLTKDVEQNASDLKKLQDDLREIDKQIAELTNFVRDLAQEVKRHEVHTGDQYDKLVLRIELALARSDRRLPPAGE